MLSFSSFFFRVWKKNLDLLSPRLIQLILALTLAPLVLNNWSFLSEFLQRMTLFRRAFEWGLDWISPFSSYKDSTNSTSLLLATLAFFLPTTLSIPFQDLEVFSHLSMEDSCLTTFSLYQTITLIAALTTSSFRKEVFREKLCLGGDSMHFSPIIWKEAIIGWWSDSVYGMTFTQLLSNWGL